MTKSEMRSTIKNNVTDALSGAVANFSLPNKQIESEIDLVRSDLLFKDSKQFGKVNLKYYYQNIDDLEILCEDISNTCTKFGLKALRVRVPRVIETVHDEAINYMGHIDNMYSYKVYYNVNQVQMHKYRAKTSRKPFVWVDTSSADDHYMYMYLFNFPKLNPLKVLKVIGVFENVSFVSALNGTENSEYVAPQHMQERIIVTLTERYIRYYRQLNVNKEPNTGTDIKQ